MERRVDGLLASGRAENHVLHPGLEREKKREGQKEGGRREPSSQPPFGCLLSTGIYLPLSLSLSFSSTTEARMSYWLSMLLLH